MNQLYSKLITAWGSFPYPHPGDSPGSMQVCSALVCSFSLRFRLPEEEETRFFSKMVNWLYGQRHNMYEKELNNHYNRVYNRELGKFFF